MLTGDGEQFAGDDLGWRVPTRPPTGLQSCSNGVPLPNTSLVSTNGTEGVSELDNSADLYGLSDPDQPASSRVSKTCVLGIDPDTSGAIAWIELEDDKVMDIRDVRFEIIDTPVEIVQSSKTRQRR